MEDVSCEAEQAGAFIDRGTSLDPSRHDHDGMKDYLAADDRWKIRSDFVPWSRRNKDATPANRKSLSLRLRLVQHVSSPFGNFVLYPL